MLLNSHHLVGFYILGSYIVTSVLMLMCLYDSRAQLEGTTTFKDFNGNLLTGHQLTHVHINPNPSLGFLS